MSDKTKPDKGKKSAEETISGVLGIIMVILVFLLPLKFGVMTGVPEAPVALQTDPVRVLIMFWPPLLFSVISAFLLAGIVVFTPPPKETVFSQLLIPFSWALLFLSVLPGFINASTIDFPVIQTALFAGTASFAIALHRLLELRPELKIWLINAIILSLTVTALYGLNQYLYGFKATLNYIYEMEQKTGTSVSGQMMNRLLQTRVFSTFSICNSLGAHMILTIPIAIWGLYYSRTLIKSLIILFAVIFLFTGAAYIHTPLLFSFAAFCVIFVTALLILKTNAGQQKIIGYILMIPLIILYLFILRHTYSRGAFVGLGFATFLFMMLLPVKRTYKIALSIIALSGIAAVLSTDIAARSLKSLDVRIDYCMRATEMFFRHPFAGTGWGDFFHEYMRTKKFPGTEAPHTPHNMILSFASQAGILGLIAAITVMCAPVVIFFRNYFSSNRLTGKELYLNICIISGWSAWCIHSLADLNIQIPGTIATAITLVMIMNSEITEKEKMEKQEKATDANHRTLILVLWYGITPLIILTAVLFSVHQIKFDTYLVRLNAALNPLQKKYNHISESQFANLLSKCRVTAAYSPIPWMTATKYAQAKSKWSMMETYAKEAIKHSPERANLYYSLYTAQIQQGKYCEAADNLKKAAELFPNSYREQYNKLMQTSHMHRGN